MNAHVILSDPWPRSASMTFRGDMQARFLNLGTVVGQDEGQAARPETVGRWRNRPGRTYAPGTKL